MLLFNTDHTLILNDSPLRCLVSAHCILAPWFSALAPIPQSAGMDCNTQKYILINNTIIREIQITSTCENAEVRDNGHLLHLYFRKFSHKFYVEFILQ